MEEVFEETNIKPISQDKQQDDWFTITGTKVPVPPPKGLYIHNKKKSVIR